MTKKSSNHPLLLVPSTCHPPGWALPGTSLGVGTSPLYLGAAPCTSLLTTAGPLQGLQSVFLSAQEGLALSCSWWAGLDFCGHCIQLALCMRCCGAGALLCIQTQEQFLTIFLFSSFSFSPSVLSWCLFPGSVDPLEGLTAAPSNNSDTGK